MKKQEREEIGDVIRKLRQERKVSIEQLCAGLCSPSQLARIELGERIAGKLLQDRLLARLGVSADDYENYLFYEDYVRWKRRQQLLHRIRQRDLRQAKSLLWQYREEYDVGEEREKTNRYGAGGKQEGEMIQYDSARRLERQFCLSMEIQIRRQEGACHRELADLCFAAAELTVPREIWGKKRVLLSVQEYGFLTEGLCHSERENTPELLKELLTLAG